MKIPTIKEVELASKQWAAEGILPLAQVIDSSEELTYILNQLVKCSGFSPFSLELGIRSAIVAGLNFGIRIGENRGCVMITALRCLVFLCQYPALPLGNLDKRCVYCGTHLRESRVIGGIRGFVRIGLVVLGYYG